MSMAIFYIHLVVMSVYLTSLLISEMKQERLKELGNNVTFHVMPSSNSGMLFPTSIQHRENSATTSIQIYKPYAPYKPVTVERPISAEGLRKALLVFKPISQTPLDWYVNTLDIFSPNMGFPVAHFCDSPPSCLARSSGSETQNLTCEAAFIAVIGPFDDGQDEVCSSGLSGCGQPWLAGLAPATPPTPCILGDISASPSFNYTDIRRALLVKAGKYSPPFGLNERVGLALNLTTTLRFCGLIVAVIACQKIMPKYKNYDLPGNYWKKNSTGVMAFFLINRPTRRQAERQLEEEDIPEDRNAPIVLPRNVNPAANQLGERPRFGVLVGLAQLQAERREQYEREARRR